MENKYAEQHERYSAKITQRKDDTVNMKIEQNVHPSDSFRLF